MSDGSQLLLKHVDFEDNTEAVRGMLERYCSSIQEYVKNGVTAEADEDTLVVDFLRSLTPIPRSTALEKAVETGSWNDVLAKADPEDRLGKHHVADQVVGSKWRSRKVNDYLDF